MDFNKQLNTIQNEIVEYLNFMVEKRNVQTLDIKHKHVWILNGNNSYVDKLAINKFIDKDGYEYDFDSVELEYLADFATNLEKYL